jgi:anthranilate phosphoribosyltransferase
MPWFHSLYSAKLSKLCDNKGMGIGHYIKEIGRGKDGARSLTREQAADLLGQVLDQQVSDLEIGAFCLAMRIKGETPEEMLGFLDAIHAQMQVFTNNDLQPVVVLPSYNGSRRLPLLTPLLAKILAHSGHAVLIHGANTEDTRVSTQEVLSALGIAASTRTQAIAKGEVVFAPTRLLCEGIWSLLQVRRQTGLRNSAHSLVKLMNPVLGPSIQVASYTHPEYALSMQATLEGMKANALLLRGTEGEPVADPRKLPNMRCFIEGQAFEQLDIAPQVAHDTIDMPMGMNAVQTAEFIDAMIQGHTPIPPSIQVQAELISRLSLACMDQSLRNGTP